ncbi:hypothetical protein VCR12J2_1080003 [Vibrio coralliirubri]|nr:hypothetical protein VCR12J2_1080003 [Vibrio coralliirubri]
MIPDTKLGGKVSTINEVFTDNTTTTYISAEFKIDAQVWFLTKGTPYLKQLTLWA